MLPSTYIRIAMIGFTICFANSAPARYVESDPIGLEGGIDPYVYVVNNPIRNIDPDGLLCKNKKSVNYPWQNSSGTDMPTGEAFKALACIEKCTGKGDPILPYPADNGTSCSSNDLMITGGSECEPFGSHQPGTTLNSSHCKNKAFDLPPSGNNKSLLCCAKKCGVKYVEDEGNHLHFQMTGGGKKNILPNNSDCCSIN
jgi:uncharacterized protein RhaS with RHS repeats